jgi:hypothetical protein
MRLVLCSFLLFEGNGDDDDGSIDFRVRSSHFESSRSVCMNFVSFSMTDRASTIVHGASTVAIEDSIFVGHGFGEGSACQFKSSSAVHVSFLVDGGMGSLGRKDAQFSLTVSNSTFSGHRATSGAAIRLQRGFCRVKVVINDSEFTRNSVQFNGGAIEVAGPMMDVSPFVQRDLIAINRCKFTRNSGQEGGAVWLGFADNGEFSSASNVLLRVQDSTFASNVGVGGGDHIQASVLMGLDVSNSTFVGGQQPLFALAGFASPAGQLSLRSSIATCDAGQFGVVSLESFQDASFGTMIGGRLRITCSACPVGFFNLVGQSAVFDDDGNLTAPLGAATGCFECPLGSRFNCTGADVGAAQNFWGTASTSSPDSVTFVRCPPNFCCPTSSGCAAMDACANNRTGVLCGACADGFVAGVAFQNKCVDVHSVCGSWRTAGGVLLFAAVTGVLSTCMLLSDPKSTGLPSVLLTFFNTGSILLEQLSQVAPEDDAAAGVTSAFAVASGLFAPFADSMAVCVTSTLSSLQRLLLPLAVLGAMVAWHLAGSLLWILWRRWRCDRRQADAEPLVLNDDADRELAAPISLRIVSSFLVVLNFNLFLVVKVLVSLLVTVTLPGQIGCRLWRAGDQRCDAWQVAVGAALFATLSFPLWLDGAVRWRRESLLARATLLVFRSPYCDGTAAQSYHLASTARRAALALAASFVIDAESRLALIRAILLLTFAWFTFLDDAPFKSALANRLEKLSVLVALAVALSIDAADASKTTLRGLQIGALALTLAVLAIATVATWMAAWIERRRVKRRFN